jgi:uncharacterized protein YktA (UPF0223 family)
MKGKLHKMVSGYILSLNGDIDDPYAILNEELAKDYEWHRLSLKNCLSIERGYDLEELAKTEYPIGEVWNEEEALIRELAFKKGFQKALELMGDKKFSEEDLMEAYSRGQTNSPIQSIQQTEWDVEIVTFTGDDLKSVSEDWGKLGKPKLDADGCLILKRSKSE